MLFNKLDHNIVTTAVLLYRIWQKHNKIYILQVADDQKEELEEHV